MEKISKGIKAVYLIKCLPTNESYIGSTICLSTRWRGHINKLNIGQHENKRLQSLYNDYGKDAFDIAILRIIGNDAELKAEEKRFISLMQPELNVKYMVTADEPKQVFTYRAKPSVVKKAKQKCKKIKVSISEKLESLLIDFSK